jgi:transcriptional regulator with XRE-family HTH domain
MPTDATFAAALRRLRAAAGLSQGALAAKARCTPTAIQHWENGRRRPTAASLKRLAKALGVPAAELAPEDGQ